MDYDTFKNQLIWERYFWIHMKSVVYTYHKVPQKSLKKNMYNVFINMSFMIPHKVFQKYFLEYLENVSIINFLDSKDHMMNYLYDLYVYIFRKSKEEFNIVRKLNNGTDKEFEDLYKEEPESYQTFWDDYVNIYKEIRKFNHANLSIIRNFFFAFIFLALIYLILRVYDVPTFKV